MGFGLGSVFSSVINPSSLAMLAAGPAGWAALAAKTVFSAVGQQVIQQVGQQLGLPQSVIDLGQATLSAQMGDFQGAFGNAQDAIASIGAEIGASPLEIGEAQSHAQGIVDDFVSSMIDSIRQQGDEQAEGGAPGAKGGSLLMKIAVALGQLLDQKMTDMADKTDEIGSLGTIDNSNSSKMGQLTGELQGLSQESNMLSNALSNTIKAIGEAGSTLARKG